MNAINTDLLLGFLLTITAIVVVPGPSVVFIVGRALAVGRPAALAAAAGNTAGLTVQGLLAGFGFGAVIAHSPVVFTVIKFAGAAYLLSMGVHMLRDRQMVAMDAGAEDPRGRGWDARKGFVVGVTNPKVMLFFAAVLPQFVDPTRGHMALQMLVLLGAFFVVSLVSDTSWGMAGGAIRTWTTHAPRRIEYLMAASGLCIIVFAVMLTV